MIAAVAGVINLAISSGSMLNVSPRISANTGVAPSRVMHDTEAKNVKEGTMTSSPGPMPSAISDSNNASEPEAQPMAESVEAYAAISVSSCVTSGPNRKRPESTTLVNDSMNSSRIGALSRLTSISGTRSMVGWPAAVFGIDDHP